MPRGSFTAMSNPPTSSLSTKRRPRSATLASPGLRLKVPKRARKAEVERALKELKQVERAQRRWPRQVAFVAALLAFAAMVAGGIVFVARNPARAAAVRDRLGAIAKKFVPRRASSAPAASA